MRKHSFQEHTGRPKDDPTPQKIFEGGTPQQKESEWIELAIQVLLVHDNLQDPSLVQRVLDTVQDSGIEITNASSINNARHLIEAKTFDLVLLDFSMADLSGIEVIAKIQKINVNLPIVVLSSNDDDSLGYHIIESGAQDYLVKGKISGNQLSRSIRYAVLRKASEKRLKILITRDQLTGLVNRAGFEEALEHALALAQRKKQEFALMFLDLDGFKAVNDTYGHGIGDEFLVEYGKRLKSILRECDVVARLGGDEFTIILVDSDGWAGAEVVAKKILDIFQQAISVGGTNIVLGTSIGIAVYPHCGSDPASLTRSADSAMYLAKRQGRNRYRVFSESLNDRMEDIKKLELKLKQSIQDNNFILHFQPLVGLTSGRTIAMEALLRWVHPETGQLVPPNDFIPLAEETGLIVPIGRWVLQKACEQHQIWKQSGLHLRSMCVNISARQLENEDFLEDVIRIIKETGIAPSELELELTETALIYNFEKTKQILTLLRAMKVRISIDDFGTGYCSLSYLRSIEFDTLKIDRSFIKSLHEPITQAIIHAIISMAQKLNLSVVAEGIETSEQLELVNALGADVVQGFYLAKPCAADQLAEYIDLGQEVISLNVRDIEAVHG